MQVISWPNTGQITFRSATLSFRWPLSLKIASGVSDQEQLRFTNNDEACHASFPIRHPGSLAGRWSVLHKNQLSVKYTSLQCLLLWNSSAALYCKSRLGCDITVYHGACRGLHWEWVQFTPDEMPRLSYVGISVLYETALFLRVFKVSFLSSEPVGLFQTNCKFSILLLFLSV